MRDNKAKTNIHFSNVRWRIERYTIYKANLRINFDRPSSLEEKLVLMQLAPRKASAEMKLKIYVWYKYSIKMYLADVIHLPFFSRHHLASNTALKKSG